MNQEDLNIDDGPVGLRFAGLGLTNSSQVTENNFVVSISCKKQPIPKKQAYNKEEKINMQYSNSFSGPSPFYFMFMPPSGARPFWGGRLFWMSRLWFVVMLFFVAPPFLSDCSSCSCSSCSCSSCSCSSCSCSSCCWNWYKNKEVNIC